MKLFVTGIGTDVGKTLVSCQLVQTYNAGYWKPIQAGDLHHSDSMKVRHYTQGTAQIFPERYALKLPASPYQAALQENIEMHLSDFELPHTTSALIVEGAGGLFVPIAKNVYILDLIKHLGLDVVLVIRDYLGAINHSILSIEAIKQAGLKLDRVVFNGTFNPHSIAAIQSALPESMSYMYLPEFASDFKL